MAHATTHEHDHHDDHHGAPKNFFVRWCMSTNHKDIGTLYLVFSLLMFFIGGSFAMVIRAELFKPGVLVVTPGDRDDIILAVSLAAINGAA